MVAAPLFEPLLSSTTLWNAGPYRMGFLSMIPAVKQDFLKMDLLIGWTYSMCENAGYGWSLQNFAAEASKTTPFLFC